MYTRVLLWHPDCVARLYICGSSAPPHLEWMLMPPLQNREEPRMVQIQHIDRGKVHSSAASSMVDLITNRLRHGDIVEDIRKG